MPNTKSGPPDEMKSEVNARADIEISHAFVLTAADAEKIWSMLAKSFDVVKAYAQCADSIKREFVTVDALTQYDNPRSRAILSLTYEARSTQSYAHGLIKFDEGYSSSIEVTIFSAESTVLAIRDRLDDLLDGMRPWYSRISRVDFFYVVTGALVLGLLVFQAMSPSSAPEKEMTFTQAVLAATVVLAAMFGVGVLIWGLNKLRRRFFPVAAFAIGQGEARFNVDEKLRWGVLVAFGVSVFASLVAAFLLSAA